LIALRTSPPSFSVAEGERIARDSFGLAVQAAPLHGERDCNLHLRTARTASPSGEYVLKIMDVAADAAAVECLGSALEWLAEQDSALAAPRILPSQAGEIISRFSRNGVPYAACLLSFVPGTLLSKVPANRTLLRNVGEHLARVDRALQGFFHPAFARRLAWDMRQLPELVQFSRCIGAAPLRQGVEAVAARTRDLLPRLRGLRSQAIHGDCHGQNVLIAEDGVTVSGLLDFGDMIHAPVVFEPAIAMAELCMEGVPLEDLSALLAGYARHQALEPNEVELLFDLIRARHAAAILLHAYRRQHDAAGAALLEPAADATAASFMALGVLEPADLLQDWHRAAGTTSPRAAAIGLPRRHQLLGAGAELFYQEPLHFVRGEGVWLFDPEGRAYLDVYNNVPHVGHAHPHVVRAISRQSAVLATHTRYLHGSILRYAEGLTSRLPPHLNACIFVNSGSEANDVAWRIVKMATGQRGALIMRHAYHGITDAIGALTPGSQDPQEPWVAALALPKEGDSAECALRAADEAIARLNEQALKPAAWFVDSALTSSGIFDPPAEWAQTIAARVRAAGGLVVADEVQYGLGRSGSHFWGFERRGLSPDIVTLGKPIGNGFPMGAIVANRDLIEEFQRRFGFFSTFGGNAVAAEAGLAVLQVIDEEHLMANALATGEYLRDALLAAASRHPQLGRVRGSGLLLGLPVNGSDVASAKARTRQIVNQLAARHRVLVGAEGPTGSVLKLRPPMSFRIEHADRLLQALDAAAAALA
jgi:4-aminobutyrate aminotransferase-like enzyme/Ser/Thr protein kinase RdoA (MazF antagonist)